MIKLKSYTAGPRCKFLFRPLRRNGKSRSEPAVIKIDFNSIEVFPQRLFHKKGKSVDIKHLVIVFWLIQSQSKRGPGSPAWRHINPEG